MKLEQLKVFIIGLGQIGGSIAKTLTGKNLVANVCGYDSDKSITQLAEKHRYIHNPAESIADGLSQADLIILATPIRTTIRLIPEIVEQTKTNQAILDVAGIQAGILNVVSMQNCSVNYISGHPIAGSEKTGLEAATMDKFKKSTFFLSPADTTKREWIGIVRELILVLGAKPVLIDPRKHDSLISRTSNLPYLLAIALMNLVSRGDNSNGKIRQMAGGSFRSATRVALSSPDLTLDMFLSNGDCILNALKDFQTELSAISESISNRDESSLRERIILAKQHREIIDRIQDE